MSPTRPAGASTSGTDEPEAPDARGTTVTEAVATTVGGMVVGGAVLWFLAPICFSC